MSFNDYIATTALAYTTLTLFNLHNESYNFSFSFTSYIYSIKILSLHFITSMNSFATPPSPPPHFKTATSMLYYGLIVAGTAAIILAVYNVLIIRWCNSRRSRSNQLVEITSSRSFENPTSNGLSSFKYSKSLYQRNREEFDSECSVCLSNFEDGEEIRQLPVCKHYFHVVCIDMWLYSHNDCPLCRSPVNPGETSAEDSRDVLLGSGMSV